MMQRRAFLQGLCGLVAAPFVMPTLPVEATHPLPVEPGIAPCAASVVFTIQGWEGDGVGDDERVGQQIVPLYLPSSWRSSWL